MTNLGENLLRSAERGPDNLAIICGEQKLSYAEFNDAVARAASMLSERGVQPGSRVGIMMPNTPAFAVLFYATMWCGGVAVPMNPLFKAGEIEFYLTNTTATLLLAARSFEDEATKGAGAAGVEYLLVDDTISADTLAQFVPRERPLEVDDSTTAVILHTSGTTGRPKGAELTHGGLGRNAEITVRTLINVTSDDVIMGCLPLFHVFGMTCGLNSAVLAGATLNLIPRFDPRAVLDTIRRDHVTIFEGVPTMYSALIAARKPDDDTGSLRACISGGAALPEQVIADFEESFQASILEGYGLSETSPVACFNHPDKPRKVGTIGTPIEGVEMRLVDTDGRPVADGESGEIQIRGHNVMKGYWKLPEATAKAIDADGWFSTGDVGVIDEDGYYRIVDRTKDMIIRGGFNIYPREIEEVIYAHPAVAAAAVIGIPHDSLGEEVGAAVALKPGAEVTADELRGYVKERVAGYKYPRHVWFVDQLPTGPTGKIQKRDITVPEGVGA